MVRRLLLAVLCLALTAPVVRAQSVDDVLAKHFEAMGGADKLRAMKAMRLTGKMAIGPGMEAPFTMTKKRPGMMRMDFTIQGMTGTQAWDGKQGWSVMPFMGKKDPEPIAAEDAKSFEDQADFDGPLMDWKTKGHTVELMGKEQVEGADCYKLKITKKSGDVDYYYVDAETYLLVKEEGKRTRHGTEMEAESSFGDYKEVNGLMFPFSLSSGVKGMPQKQSMTFEKIEVDPELADSFFAMPASAAPADSAAAKPAPKADAKPAAPKKK